MKSVIDGKSRKTVHLSSEELCMITNALDMKIWKVLSQPICASKGWIPPEVQKMRELVTRLTH
jgi:hypothetical protein